MKLNGFMYTNNILRQCNKSRVKQYNLLDFEPILLYHKSKYKQWKMDQRILFFWQAVCAAKAKRFSGPNKYLHSTR